MFQPLLTKLIAPQANASQVQRLDLLHQLNQGLRTVRLTLVSAQAGSGKTTLLGQWAASAPNLEIIWLTLDKADNSPTRFWSYVVAAFATRLSALGETGHQLIEMLQTPQNGLQPIPIETILTELINASFQQPNTSPKDICLVLDDYHLVDNSEIHGAVTDLLDFLPPNLHLLIATRSDPELPLASLRARGQLMELRTENLRFSTVEATAFYNEAMQLGLTPQQIATLEKRTEGWPAGMQLLALSLRNLQGKEREQFIQTFSGTHRYIIDYLAQEILEKLPKAVQKFLLQTSILERLNGPLCEAVTRPENSTAEGSGEGIENQSGQARLENLAAENLFVSRLDEQSQWFRYHQLFATVLQNRLTQLYPPSFCLTLHMRAAQWFVNQGWLAEALTHYFAAKNYLEAARLLISSLGEWWQKGELLNLISWIEKLPLEEREQFPQLEIIRAWPIVLTGQVGRVNDILQSIESRQKNSELLSPNPSDQQKSLNSWQGVNPPAQLVILQGQVNFLKGYLALAQTKWAEAISYFEAALLDLPKKNELEHPLPWWLMALTSLGWAYRFSGRPHQARQAYEQAIALCRANQDLAALCGAISYLTELEEEAGKLQHAARVCRETIREAEEKLGTGLARVYMSGLFAGLGRINYNWNNLTEAENYFNLALHYSGVSGKYGKF